MNSTQHAKSAKTLTKKDSHLVNLTKSTIPWHSAKEHLGTGSSLVSLYENSCNWEITTLREAALHGKLLKPRGVAWGILLQTLPCDEEGCLKVLKENRQSYEILKTKLTCNPRNVDNDDPLSQKDESVWNQHFCDKELRALISQDVSRTFPGDDFFRRDDVQQLMTRILFVRARYYPQIGYRQGMHEILAPLLFELQTDCDEKPDYISSCMNEILDPKYVEHDSFMLLGAVMDGIESFYKTGELNPSPNRKLSFPEASPQIQNEAVKHLENLKNRLLTKLDPEMSNHFEKYGISMSYFGIRWLRLLFGREFPKDEVPILWSSLFSDGPSLPLIDYVVVAMLISIRNSLLVDDPAYILSSLMRPATFRASHIIALALHYRHPQMHNRPATPPVSDSPKKFNLDSSNLPIAQEDDVESTPAEEGLAEGADIARELALLAVMRAKLPEAAAALAIALPRPTMNVAKPLTTILQLATLVQSRSPAMLDVETALEANEMQPVRPNANKSRPKVMVPIKVNEEQPHQVNSLRRKNFSTLQKKEVQLRVFNQSEGGSGLVEGAPSLDPLKIRTD